MDTTRREAGRFWTVFPEVTLALGYLGLGLDHPAYAIIGVAHLIALLRPARHR